MPRLDMAMLQQEAARIQNGSVYGRSSTPMREIEEYEWRDGLNILRLMYPTYEMETIPFIFKLEYTHFQLPPKSSAHRCLVNTFPELQALGIKCEICETTAYIYHQHGIDCSAQRPSVKAIANAVDRQDEKSGPWFGKFPVSVYNWAVNTMAAQSIDLMSDTDGIDLFITKSGSGMGTEYTCNTSAKGCSKLHLDDGVIKKWHGDAYDLTKIFKTPDVNSDNFKQALARIHTFAEQLKMYHNIVPQGSVNVPVAVGAPGAQMTQAAPPTTTPEMEARELAKAIGSVDWLKVADPQESAYMNQLMDSMNKVPVGQLALTQDHVTWIKNLKEKVFKVLETKTPPPPAPPAIPEPPKVQAPAPPPVQQVASVPQPPTSAIQPTAVAAAPAPVVNPEVKPPFTPTVPPPTPQPASFSAPPPINSPEAHPACYGLPINADVVVDNIKGGYRDGEPRCMLCPFEPDCSATAKKKYPEQYA